MAASVSMVARVACFSQIPSEWPVGPTGKRISAPGFSHAQTSLPVGTVTAPKNLQAQQIIQIRLMSSNTGKRFIDERMMEHGAVVHLLPLGTGRLDAFAEAGRES